MTRQDRSGAVRVSVDLPLDPAAALAAVLEELRASLELRGIRFEAAPGARLTRDGREVGRVVDWEAGTGGAIEWPAVAPDAEPTTVEIRAEAAAGGSRVSLATRGGGSVPRDGEDLAAWFVSEVAAGFAVAPSPERLGDWITDRHARRPTGAQSRATYRDPLYHYPNFQVILAELGLAPGDGLLEVACGGGALLGMALASGCRAVGVDHSRDMVRVARELNADAVAEGRLALLLAEAESLPLADGRFTCAAMTGVLGFLRDPVAALAEIRRVLAPGGRVVIAGSDPELRGTPGAPEPFASRLRFYDEAGLEDLGRAAGFDDVRAVRRPMEEHAREAGVPEEHLPLFAGPGGRFLLARRGGD